MQTYRRTSGLCQLRSSPAARQSSRQGAPYSMQAMCTSTKIGVQIPAAGLAATTIAPRVVDAPPWERGKRACFCSDLVLLMVLQTRPH